MGRNTGMQETNLLQTKALLQFIEEAPTAFHAVDAVKKQLLSNGFSELREGDLWDLTAGCGYFVTRNRSSVIAFRVPAKAPHGFLISASHTDSPMFKLKNEALVPTFGEYLRLNTEVYGGTILSSWVDRPLTLAGRVILRNGDSFKITRN